ncbi:MAG: geranylgeranylglycerol-phosphate geranylgeranyltransferase [Bacteroidia bacterium]|jgi:4-hydroxybenzoate polyprenyltransferase
MVQVLKLVRAGNLIIMLLTQVLVYFCLSVPPFSRFILPPSFVLVLLATMMAAAGGYVINDYHDIKTDRVNKPNRVIIGQQISRRQGMALHLSLSGIAILLGWSVNLKVSIAVLCCCLVLWAYAITFKKQFLTGNLIVASLSAFTLLILQISGIQLHHELLWTYAGIAFLISLIREIIKDMEDIEGDRLDQCKTLPIVWGIKRSKQFVFLLNLLLLAQISGFVYIVMHPTFSAKLWNQNYFLWYSSLFILLPVLTTMYRLLKAETKTDFGHLSNWYKFIMLTGILSMVLFRI